MVRQVPFRSVVLLGLVRDQGASACLKSFLFSFTIPRLAFSREIQRTFIVEWIYHVLKDGKSFQEVERAVKAIGRGEPVNSSGNAK